MGMSTIIFERFMLIGKEKLKQQIRKVKENTGRPKSQKT